MNSTKSWKRTNLEVLEDRLCLSAATANGVTGPVSVFSAAVATFETKENAGGDYFGETGRIEEVDETWKTIRFQRQFDDPVVVAGPPSFSDTTPATVRVRNITSEGFDVRIQQWDYSDGDHQYEELFYLVVERGTYETSDGTRFVADTTSSSTAWATEAFATAFTDNPVVLGQVVSDDDQSAVGLKLSDVTSAGFDFRLQPELAGPLTHGTETVGYIAIDSGVGVAGFETGILDQAVDHLFHDVSFTQSHSDPFFFATSQSNSESDPGHLRYYKNEGHNSLTTTGVAVRYQEEDSRNAPKPVPDTTLRRHAAETIGYAVLDSGYPMQGFSVADGNTRIALPPVQSLQYGAVKVGDLELGSGLAPSGTVFDDQFSAIGWDMATVADAIAGDDYLAFSLDIDSGYSLNLTSLDLSVFSDVGNREFALFSSAIGVTAGDVVATIAPTMSSDSTIGLSAIPALQGLTGTQQFRVYGFGHTASNDAAGIQPSPGGDLVLHAEVIAVPPSAPSITVADISVDEGVDPFAVFDIQLSDALHDATIVDVDSSAGTATLGSDFGPGQEYSLDGGSTWSSGTQFSLPVGHDRILVRIPVNDDSDFETSETFHLCVSLLGPTLDLSYAPVTATIGDDDRSLFVTETGPDTVVSEFGIRDSVEVALSEAPGTDVVVSVSADTSNEVSFQPALLLFTPTNWQDPQVLDISGIEDGITDGDTSTLLTFEIVDVDSDPAFADVPSRTVVVTNVESDVARVVDRHVFYNNSRFDGDSPSLEAADDDAVAPSPTAATNPMLGKQALVAGQTATLQNYTSYFRGINGIMLDVMGLANPSSITVNDFQFRVGNDNSPGSWPLATPPTDLQVRPGAGSQGADRITLAWPDELAIKNDWLQVTMLPTVATGLRRADVHYWGNAIGETGTEPGNAFVNAIDAADVRSNPKSIFDLAGLDNPFDFDRDRTVTVVDAAIARSNVTSIFDSLRLIAPELTVTIDAVDKDTETAGDFITDDQTLYIHGTFTEGSSLSVSFAGSSFMLGADDELTSDGHGNWTLNYSAVVLAEGDYLASVTSQLGVNQADASQTITVAPPPPPPPPTPDVDSDLAALWTFDGDRLDSALLGAVADDLNEQGETGLIIGGIGTHALHSSGGIGNGLFVPDSVDINNQSLDEYSVSLWFHTRDDATGTQVLYQQGDETEGLIIYVTEGQLFSGAWNTSVGWSGTWLTAETEHYAWNHITVSIDATADQMQLYANGFLADQGFAAVVPPHATASIGGADSAIRVWNPISQAVETITPASFLGWIDDVRVYQRVLNSSDTKELATAPVVRKVVADLPIEANVPAPTYELPTGGTTYDVPASATTAELQTILDGLQGNDIVKLAPMGSWESIILRNTTPGPKYIISSAMDSLPAFGQRVDPTYAAFMPTISTGTMDTGPVLPAINSEIGASDYHIAGIHFVKPIITGATSGVAGHHGSVSLALLNRVPVGGANNTLPPLSPPVLGEPATTYEALGGNIVFDRSIFEGDDIRTRNGIILTAKDSAVVGSYFHKIIARKIVDGNGVTLVNPTESHGIEIVNSPGRILLENNYLSVGSIGVMLGNNGGLTTETFPTGGQIPGLVPPMADIVVRGNFITKDLAWASEITAVTGSAAIKNALETKGANRLLWEDNFIENILNGNQKHAMVVKVSDGQETDNVTIRNNHVVQATGGAFLSNHLDPSNGDAPLRVGNITLHDNNIEDIGPMPPTLDESFAIINVSSLGDPIEAVVMFDNNLRRRNYYEDREVGFAFSNNQEQHITDFSFLSNQMDCAQYGGIVGTGLGANVGNVLNNFTENYSLEDNVFIACLPGYNIPPGNTIFAAWVNLAASITSDDVINAAEATQMIPITGTLTGDAKVNDAVTLVVNENSYGGVATLVGSKIQFTIDVDGSDLAADADSTIDVEFTTTDAAGNSITPTDTESYAVDLTAPVLSIDPIAGEDIINAVEGAADVVVSGTTDAEDGQEVTVTLNSQTYSGSVSNGVWSVSVPSTDVSSLSSVETVTADATDAAGNPAIQASRTLTYDPNPPAAPVSVQITEDTNDDGFINASELDGDINVTVELPGDAAAGDTLTVTDGATPQEFVLTSADITANNVLTSFAAPAEGATISISAHVTDIAENVGAASSDNATLDTTPYTVAINVIADDDIINGIEDDSDVIIAGTTDAVDGQQVTVTLNGETYLDNVLTGTWAINVPVADVANLLPNQTVTADISDPAGNPAIQATRTLTYDPNPPAAPVSVQITEDTNNDGFINASELDGDINVTVELPGDALAGDTLTITDGATPQEFVLTSADITATNVLTSFAAPAEGATISISAHVTDISENVGTATSDSATVDTTPDTVAINVIADDDIINGIEDDSDVTISGTTDAVDGQEVTVTLNGETYLDNVLAGGWAITVPVADVGNLLPSQTVTADVSDPAGNAAVQAARTLNYDPNPPAAPVSVQITEDTNNDGFINASELDGDINVTVELPGDALAGDTLTITDGVTPQEFVLTSADITATNVLTSFAAPAEGATISISAHVSDIAENVGAASSDNATLDTTPYTVAINVIADDDIINGIEDDSDVTIAGTTDAGDGKEVTVTLNGETYFDNVLTGAWAINVPVADVANLLPSQTVTADISDPAGNAAVQATRTLTYDPNPPAAPVSVQITEDTNNDGFINASELDGDINVTVELPGDAVAGDTLTITDGATPQDFVLTSADITATNVLTSFAAPAESATISISAHVTDISENVGAASSDNATVDTTPYIVAISVIADDDIINGTEDDSDVTIVGTTDAVDGQQVTVTLNGETYLDNVLAGGWSITVPVADVGNLLPSQTVTADISDPAGNPAIQATRTLTYDPNPPAVPVSVQITEDTNDDGFINASELDGDINVTVELPGDAVAGDTLTVTDGATPQEFVLTSADITANNVLTSFAAPAEGATISISAHVTDIAENVGAASSDNATLDTTPYTVAINVIADDDIINGIEDDSDVIIAGTTDAGVGQAVTVTLNGIAYNDTAANGTWAITVSAAEAQALAATQSLTAEVIDIAGNIATAMRDLDYDPDPPVAPVVTITEDADNNGFIEAAELDGDINVTVQPPTNAVVGDKVTVTDGSSSEDVILTATQITNGVFTSFVSPGIGNTITVTAHLTDAAGNVGDSAFDSAEIGSPPPSAPPISSGSKKTDNATREAKQTGEPDAERPQLAADAVFALVGDLDLDGLVGFSDFLALSANFGSSNASRSDGDINGDGKVSFEDFLRLSANFGKSTRS